MGIAEHFISAGDKLKSISGKLDKLTTANITGIVMATSKNIAPLVRSELANSYKSSGVKIDSDTLYSATVTNARVTVSPKGLYIGMGSGNYPSGKGNVYAAAASHKYGSVRSPQEHQAVRDTVSGNITRHETRSVLGARAKRSIKKGALSSKAAKSLAQGINGKNVKRRSVDLGEVSVIPAKNGFFTLDESQVSKIAAAMARMIQEELVKRGFSSGGGKAAA